MAPNKKAKQKRRKEKKAESVNDGCAKAIEEPSVPKSSGCVPEVEEPSPGQAETSMISHTPKPVVPVHVRYTTSSCAMLASLPQLNLKCLTRPPPKLPEKLLQTGFEPDVGARMDLGSGAYASVRCVRHSTGQRYALKIMEKHPLEIRNMIPQLKRELGIQNALRHQNILRVVSILEDSLYVYMLLDFCGGGTLRTLCHAQPLKRLAEAHAAGFLYQIYQGVEYMHQHGIVHRDLKGDNILLTESLEVRICDFGWSAQCSAEKALLTTCGTPEFWAPELWTRSPQGYYTDVWALGCLMYEVLVGHPPFWGSNEEMRQKVLMADVRYPPGFTESAVHLMFCHFQVEPEKRAPVSWSLRSHGFFAAQRAAGGPDADPPPSQSDPQVVENGPVNDAKTVALVATPTCSSEGSTNSGSSRSLLELND